MSRRKSTFAWLALVLCLFAASARAQDCAPVPDGIVSWWPAEGDATDIISGNNGTVLGGTTFDTGMVGICDESFLPAGFYQGTSVGT